MGALIPSIPYKSQYDLDAGEFRNDCGPAALAMLLHGFGVNVSTNAVYRRTGAIANHYVSVGQLMRAALTYNVLLDYFHSWTTVQLAEILRAGRPVIALVHYGAWSELNPGISTQNTFAGPHFVAVVGADEDYIYVNDPLWRDARRNEGFRKRWTHTQFAAAWNTCHLDGNRDGSGLVTQQSLATMSFGSGGWEPVTNLQFNPQLICRIRAWAVFMGAPEPNLETAAAADAYLATMDGWGNRMVRHTVTANDDLGLLALRYYGDPLKWGVILAFNGLRQTDPILDGDILLIPEPLQSPVAVPEGERPAGGTYQHERWLLKERLEEGRHRAISTPLPS